VIARSPVVAPAIENWNHPPVVVHRRIVGLSSPTSNAPTTQNVVELAATTALSAVATPVGLSTLQVTPSELFRAVAALPTASPLVPLIATPLRFTAVKPDPCWVHVDPVVA
jgi:hypothetical protein